MPFFVGWVERSGTQHPHPLHPLQNPLLTASLHPTYKKAEITWFLVGELDKL